MSVHTGDDPCLICDSCFDRIPALASRQGWRSKTIGRARMDFCPTCEPFGGANPVDVPDCSHIEAVNVLNIGHEAVAQCVNCGKLGRLLQNGGVIWAIRMPRVPGATDNDSELRPEPDTEIPEPQSATKVHVTFVPLDAKPQFSFELRSVHQLVYLQERLAGGHPLVVRDLGTDHARIEVVTEYELPKRGDGFPYG